MSEAPFDWTITPPDANDRLLGQLVSTAPSNCPRSEAILFGLPFDAAVLGRRGAAAGPRALRAAARTMKAFHYTSGEIRRRVFDLGDAECSPDDVAQGHAQAEAWARRALALSRREDGRPPARVIALGGDHSLAFPCAWPYLEEFGARLAVINLDAHLDVRQVRAQEAFNSGTAFARLLDKGLSSYTAIGVRDFQTSPAYARRVEEAGGRIMTAREVFSKGAETLAREVLEGLPPTCHELYLSVDLDVADASVAPGVSAPTPGGLLAHQLFELVNPFASDPRCAACGIFELAPSLEEPHSDRTARLGAGCLAEMLAAL